MLQLRFIWRFFFGGSYVGSKTSAWCIDPKVRFIKTGHCCKPNLLWCIKVWQRCKYDSYMYRHDWQYIPKLFRQFVF